MHFLLYVCLPVEEAKTSLQARRRACRYLEQEHFITAGRFCGLCDYFSVGGRYSGMLTLLRLKRLHPRDFRNFLKEYRVAETPRAHIKVFKKSFPKFDGRIPVARTDVGFEGYQDDAQLMDETLFAQLKAGFNDYVTNAWAFEKPNVIFTDLDETQWPKTAKDAVGRHWVVTIAYHD
jgi:hypothetical protein